MKVEKISSKRQKVDAEEADWSMPMKADKNFIEEVKGSTPTKANKISPKRWKVDVKES